MASYHLSRPQAIGQVLSISCHHEREVEEKEVPQTQTQTQKNAGSFQVIALSATALAMHGCHTRCRRRYFMDDSRHNL
ncbi:hypothetical protein A0H81_03269 [Grifola frondosa]|uniref:Uncharacterized protein n=1 Tax=Grifola frondosa TaxID=5627 RepID=A0A1C7MJ30_GRIFR|nr:hypothetical protein A0H81_03269 [Grifola frondosa]